MIKKIKSNCKINVGLNIQGVLENGYHLLDMTMIPLELSDTMIIEFKGIKNQKLEIKTNKKGLPTDGRNILAKVYNKFYEASKLEYQEIEVYLEKIVPIQGGLGGGSSNGAFFLKELNSYHDNFFSEDELISLGKGIGADIPFFLVNKSSHITGIGEKIEVFQNNLESEIILIKPNFGVSTPEAFRSFDVLPEEEKKQKAKIFNIISGFSQNKLYNVIEGIVNQLELGLLKSDIRIYRFRNRLDSLNLGKFHMSGSGSVYFVFVEKNKVNSTLEELKEKLKDCEIYSTKFLK